MFGKKKPKSTKAQKNADYRKLGEQIESMYDAVRPDRTALYRTSFLKGVATGVGGVVGATIVVALLIWLLSFFQEIPFLGHIVESARHSLERH